MAVKVVPKFTNALIKQMMHQRRQMVLDALVVELQRVGEQFVANARSKADFIDRTGNLRSSIAYVILYNGLQLYENFQTLHGPQGESYAKKVIDEIAASFPRGLVLIGVAGMDYAAAVESKGFDVITNSANIAERELKRAMKNMKKRLKQSL